MKPEIGSWARPVTTTPTTMPLTFCRVEATALGYLATKCGVSWELRVTGSVLSRRPVLEDDTCPLCAGIIERETEEAIAALGVMG